MYLAQTPPSVLFAVILSCIDKSYSSKFNFSFQCYKRATQEWYKKQWFNKLRRLS